MNFLEDGLDKKDKERTGSFFSWTKGLGF